MKLYQLVAKTENGKFVRFAPSKDALPGAKKLMVEQHNISKSSIEATEVDVPTDKKGLIDYLNSLVA